MKHLLPALALFLSATALPSTSVAAPAAPTPVVADIPAHATVAEKRASGIMATLKLADTGQAARVKQHIVNFMLTTKAAYEGKTPLTGDALQQALVKARTELYAALNAEKLTADQQVIIKNGLSANHYKINYDAFLNLIPKLTDEEKIYIHKQLITAFDDAVILNEGEAKGQVFHKVRGRINNYLSKRGYDLKQLSIERNERNQKKKPAAGS